MKKLLVALAMMGLVFQTTSCIGKKSQDDTELVDNAEVEKAESELATLEGIDDSAGPVDDSLQAALGEAPQQDIIEDSPTGDVALSDVDSATTQELITPDVAATPSIDESALAAVDSEMSATPDSEITMTGPAVAEMDNIDTGITETPMDDSFAAVDTGITETPVNESPMNEPMMADTSSTDTSYDTAESSSSYTSVAKTASVKKEVSPSASSKLRKIAETDAYAFGDGFVNTVYVARPNESLADISNTIYGSDKSKELKKINSFLWRAPKAGDKIYYVSPNRPTDSSKTISFYEDTGMASETYTARKGDNLKKLGKELLGYNAGWKELWTTNPVISQGSLNDGETLRYWKPAPVLPSTNLAQNAAPVEQNQFQQEAPAQNFANNEMPPPPMPEPQMAAPGEMMPPPDMQQNMDAQNSLPPPPPPDMMPEQQMAQQAPPDLPPPPPPEDHMGAQPVPPKQAINADEEEMTEEGALSSDTMMTLGGVIVLVALLAFTLIRRNRKKKEAEMASIERTHVGT